MKHLIAIFIFIGLCSVCNAEMVSVTTRTADLLNQPGGKYTYSILKAPQYYPFQLLGDDGIYLKVRDFEGLVGWIDRNDVTNQSCIVIVRNRVNIRKGPSTTHPVVLKADKGVAFKVKGRQDEWLNVIHDSGQQGWVHQSLTWGFDRYSPE